MYPIGLMLSQKQKIHKQEIEKLIRKQQREINEILMRGGLQIDMEDPVHEAMVTCVAHIGSFLMNKEWSWLMITTKKLYLASEVLDPVWTGYGRINMGHNFSDVVGFDPDPHGNNNSCSTTISEVRSNLRDSVKFEHRSKFALRDHNNIYLIDGQFLDKINHERVDFIRDGNPMGLGNTICFSSKFIVTCGVDGYIRMWYNRSPYRPHYNIPQVGTIHDVAITFDSMFLAVRTSNTVTVKITANTGPAKFNRETNRIILCPNLVQGPMFFSETTDEIVLTSRTRSNYGKEQIRTISLIFWKYKCQGKVYGGLDHIRQVSFLQYPCSDKSQHGVSSIYISNNGTTMAIQYRSPDEIVVMKRNVDNKDKIDLVQVAKFDLYPNTFDRKILFGPSRYNDVIVFATDTEVYVASLRYNCTTLPFAYQNRNNSHPLCILPDEKAMLVTYKNDQNDNIADRHPVLIMSIPKAYLDFKRNYRMGEIEI
jgi:hypothetical protein